MWRRTMADVAADNTAGAKRHLFDLDGHDLLYRDLAVHSTDLLDWYFLGDLVQTSR